MVMSGVWFWIWLKICGAPGTSNDRSLMYCELMLSGGCWGASPPFPPLASASPAEVVVPLAGYLGADEAVATRARLDEDGR